MFKIPTNIASTPDDFAVETDSRNFTPTGYSDNHENLNFIYNTYPKNIIINLSDEVMDVVAFTPPGFITDFVELAEKACRMYEDFGSFYSISDELLGTNGVSSRSQLLEYVGVSEQQSTSEEIKKHRYIDEMCSMYEDAIKRYINALMGKLASFNVPLYSNYGCIYSPDGFIIDTHSLVLRLKLGEA